ncbi:MAG: hypothetical protein COA33_011040 [Fluviicola sp.]|nr:hypothetical protein [Fluviicola sp.]
MKNALYFLFSLLILASCSDIASSESSEAIVSQEFAKVSSATLRELSDEEYPDNPDISIRHPKSTETVMESISFEEKEHAFDITIFPSNAEDDTVIMTDIHLMEFIPSIPHCAKGDDYMTLISVVNQEWNRNQVKWTGEDLAAILPRNYTVNGEIISRIDLARNCLSSYLWELFFYTEVDGKDQVFYHGWFDFPEELYKGLFKERNDDSFDKYASYMEHWKDPENAQLDLSLIRTIESSKSVTFTDKSDEMYPLQGERKKKKIAIIYPETFSKMSDFHTDSSLFATFSEPGFYNRADPRTTELGRFYSLKKIEYSTTKSMHEGEFNELKMTFSRENGEVTQFIFGGLNFSDLPQLSNEEANSANAYSMGIANHPFYEDCNSHEKLNSRENPYFGVLLDEEGNWLDSHKIGIDGPLLHLDKDNPNILHVWLLSFERHALVGHYLVVLEGR